MNFRRVKGQDQSPKGQGGEVGDEYVTYEIEKNKAPMLAEWLNQMDATATNSRCWKATEAVARCT